MGMKLRSMLLQSSESHLQVSSLKQLEAEIREQFLIDDTTCETITKCETLTDWSTQRNIGMNAGGITLEPSAIIGKSSARKPINRFENRIMQVLLRQNHELDIVREFNHQSNRERKADHLESECDYIDFSWTSPIRSCKT